MKNFTRFHARRIPLIIGMMILGLAAQAQPEVEGDALAGEKLFKSLCASCHKLDAKLIGPALGGVTERRSTEWLHKWIKDNEALRSSGDEEANAVFEEYNGSIMTAFPSLTDEDIDNILAYTVAGGAKVVETPNNLPSPSPVEAESEVSLTLLIVLGLFFIALITLLVRMRNTVRVLKGEERVSLSGETSAFMRKLSKNTGFVTVFTIVIGIWFLNLLFNYLMSVGVEQGYQPVQPIAFSHKLHAGDNQIDCQYCHSSARNSKTSGIPSANVCMNCHMFIDGSGILDEAGQPKYAGERSPEIDKIYTAIGWNPETRTYIEDYEVKPIEWIRIHNLPDLAYFNHAQHVTAGGVECQTCHGPVETMEEVYQYSSLTMGWCIDCHRTTNVKIGTNGYYESMHEDLIEKYHGEAITVDKIGGLECGKCHY